MRRAVVGWEGGRVVLVDCRKWQGLDWGWCGMRMNPMWGHT